MFLLLHQLMKHERSCGGDNYSPLASMEHASLSRTNRLHGCGDVTDQELANSGIDIDDQTAAVFL